MLLFSYLSFQFIGANILFFSFVKQIHVQNIYCKHKKRFDEMSCSKKIPHKPKLMGKSTE